MVSLRAATLLLSLVSLTIAQSTNGPCSGTANTTFYTDSCGQQYTVYCSADSSPGAYATLNSVPDFATCMSYCSAAGSSTCTTVTYIGTTCYLKTSFSNLIRPSSGNTATIYVAVPAYPPPTTNGAYRSTGCGTPLNSAINPGGVSAQFSGNGSDGYLHNYLVHVPSTYDPNKAAPLILAFHGRGDAGGNVESGTGFSIERINPYGISIYPTAIQDSSGQNTWQGDPSWVGNSTINDLNFVKTLVANISSQFCVDTSRIFAAGFSNGGGLVNVLACDPVMSTVFNAFAPHSGAYYTQTSDSSSVCLPNSILTNDLVHAVCSPARRAPMIEFHGDNDGTIPYFGGGRRGYCLPAIPHRIGLHVTT
jgi:poly(3-hydroxybutyrate) depolymerase